MRPPDISLAGPTRATWNCWLFLLKYPFWKICFSRKKGTKHGTWRSSQNSKIESPSCKKRHVCVPKSFVLSYRFRGIILLFCFHFFFKNNTTRDVSAVFFFFKATGGQTRWRWGLLNLAGTPPDCPFLRRWSSYPRSRFLPSMVPPSAVGWIWDSFGKIWLLDKSTKNMHNLRFQNILRSFTTFSDSIPILDCDRHPP